MRPAHRAQVRQLQDLVSIDIYSEPVKKKTITKNEGLWTLEELIEHVPEVLLEGYKNPSPPQPAK